MKVETMLKHTLTDALAITFDKLKGVAYFTDSQYDITFWVYVDGSWQSCYSLVAEGSKEEGILFQKIDEIARLLRTRVVTANGQLTEVSFEQLSAGVNGVATGQVTLDVTVLPGETMIFKAKKQWQATRLV